MNSRNVWIMLALVLLLGGVVLWQQGREKSPAFQDDRPLFDGLRAERLHSIHLDHLERGLQLSLTRDADGAWQIVDPLTFPAEAGVMDRLLEVLTKNRATPVDKPDLEALRLAPPRAVLELVESLPTGDRKLRLELGEQDLDGSHVFARVDGVVVRTLLNLDTTLNRDLPDWRQRRILNVDPATVTAVRRIGKLVVDPAVGLVDLGFAAGTTESGWRSSVPWKAALDPETVGQLIASLCYLQARTFLADSAVQVPPFGLDNPDLRIELDLAGEAQEVLLLRQNRGSESWICMREGSTHVFRVENMSLVLLSIPADRFLDTQIARLEHGKVERIELRHGEQTLFLRRNAQIWKLGSKQNAVAGTEVSADPLAVADLLAAVEGAHAAKFLIDEPGVVFTAESSVGLRLFAHGAEYGCDFGAEHELSPGVPGRLFRRAGDELVGVVETRVADLASGGWIDFVERQMIKLPEKAIARIELSRKEFKRVFVRNAETGRWSAAGVETEAPKTFQMCVERLLSLRADAAVAPDGPFELADPWQVVVIDGGNVRTSYRLGALVADANARGFDDGHVRGIVTSSGLFEDLSQIQ